MFLLHISLARIFHKRAPDLACPLPLYGSFAQSTVLPGTALQHKIPKSDKVLGFGILRRPISHIHVVVREILGSL